MVLVAVGDGLGALTGRVRQVFSLKLQWSALIRLELPRHTGTYSMNRYRIWAHLDRDVVSGWVQLHVERSGSDPARIIVDSARA
jgi:hypothetical protein